MNRQKYGLTRRDRQLLIVDAVMGVRYRKLHTAKWSDYLAASKPPLNRTTSVKPFGNVWLAFRKLV